MKIYGGWPIMGRRAVFCSTIAMCSVFAASAGDLPFRSLELNAAVSLTGAKRAVDLPGVKICPGLPFLFLNVSVPPAHQLTAGAPFRIKITSGEPQVIQPLKEEPAVTAQSFPLRLPLKTAPGAGTLTVDADMFFCSPDNGVCYRDRLRALLPIEVKKRHGCAAETTLGLEIPNLTPEKR